MRAYAGIGSRQTPPEVLTVMRSLARRFAQQGLTLRSGGAPGADRAFEQGCDHAGGSKAIYLPWRGFNGSVSPLFGVTQQAMRLAAEFHPRWADLTAGARQLHARNVYQILGHDLQTPCDFVICWTRDGNATGGTGQALRIAEQYGVPVHNLQRPEEWRKAHLFLEFSQPTNGS